VVPGAGQDSAGGRSELSKASMVVASAFKVRDPSHSRILAVDWLWPNFI
jgi:hypothetical protein